MFKPLCDLTDSSLLLLGGLWSVRRLTEERKRILKGNNSISDVLLLKPRGSSDGFHQVPLLRV